MPEPEKKKKHYRWLTSKQCQFIDWLNNNFKYGEVVLKIHASEPTNYEINKITGKFDGNIKKTLDNSSGDKV